jgi:hypothetical protein
MESFYSPRSPLDDWVSDMDFSKVLMATVAMGDEGKVGLTYNVSANWDQTEARWSQYWKGPEDIDWDGPMSAEEYTQSQYILSERFIPVNITKGELLITTLTDSPHFKKAVIINRDEFYLLDAE